MKGSGIPGYLKKELGKSRWKRVAKFRLGNEMKGEWYWGKEEKQQCRMCGGRVETWKHVWEECRFGRKEERTEEKQ